MRNFGGKRAFLTGAASGIGEALALALAREGAYVIACDWNKKGVEETLTTLRNKGYDGECHGLDVGDRDAVHALASSLCAEEGGIDVVVNCAGVAQTSLVENLSYEDLEWVMRTNFWGMVYGTKAFLHHLLEKGEGHIVNVSSVFGLFSVPSQSAYHASKFAIRGFTEALRHELRETEIQVSAVFPGGIRTNIARNMRLPQMENAEEMVRKFADRFDEVARCSPEKAAETILRGMKKGKGRILIGLDARIMEVCVRLFPSHYLTAMALMRWQRGEEEELTPSLSQIAPKTPKTP